ncbi:hypothetical protein D9619_004347 [Psilocybe cf. subviscida]|uniref:Uncharacterized protein n=1 Tax=Psilocybe cf. subviscida TaxID=2480587 RepID=A0A8H5BQB4_9AGAR|nr:hypothetical protein D9619_004347 [Psilocybe cf. subviscida]
MTATAPNIFDDGEISDFMRKTRSPDGTVTTGVQDLTSVVLYAKANNTGKTFGSFVQSNTLVSSSSTNYLNVLVIDGSVYYSALHFSTTTTTLIRSETLNREPTPFEPCPGVVYRNLAVGGTVRSTNCNSPELIN